MILTTQIGSRKFAMGHLVDAFAFLNQLTAYDACIRHVLSSYCCVWRIHPSCNTRHGWLICNTKHLSDSMIHARKIICGAQHAFCSYCLLANLWDRYIHVHTETLVKYVEPESLLGCDALFTISLRVLLQAQDRMCAFSKIQMPCLCFLRKRRLYRNAKSGVKHFVRDHALDFSIQAETFLLILNNFVEKTYGR